MRKSGSSEEIIPHPQIKKFLKYEQNLMASMASSKRKTPFQHKWLLIYGLEICARDAKTSSVVSLRCRFCEFGKEGANGVSLKAKENVSFTISKSIVEVVIHQLLLEFDPDEEDVDISNLAIFSAIENEEGVEY